MIRNVFVAVFFCATAFTQANQQESRAPANMTATTQPQPGNDRIAQMRTDLNQMESLLNNMSSEVTFLRDQNLQILLNTNVRMWTILIRDMRLQLDEQERRATTPKPEKQ